MIWRVAERDRLYEVRKIQGIALTRPAAQKKRRTQFKWAVHFRDISVFRQVSSFFSHQSAYNYIHCTRIMMSFSVSSKSTLKRIVNKQTFKFWIYNMHIVVSSRIEYESDFYFDTNICNVIESIRLFRNVQATKTTKMKNNWVELMFRWCLDTQLIMHKQRSKINKT